MMSMSISATKLSISSKIIGIPSVNEEFRVQYFTSSFASTRVTHHPFVAVSLFMLLYLSPIKLSSPSLFAPQSIRTFPNSDSWLSSTFNTNHFSHFTTTNLVNTSPIDTPPTSLKPLCTNKKTIPPRYLIL